MDILTHTLSGVAAGSCLCLFAKNRWKEKGGILFFSGIGGVLPDIDVISLWSKFDGTIGKLLGLSHSGKDIYSAKFWYSHHSFMHSLLAAILFTVIIELIIYFISKKRRDTSLSLFTSLQKYYLIGGGFFLAYVLHLLEDMVTPGGPWGGIRFFFPSEVYIGGTGDIWWWNNYDIFLIIFLVLVVNLILLLVSSFIKVRLGKIGVIACLLGCLVATIQIKTRDFNFNRKAYEVCEEKSKQIQHKILGKRVYSHMERFDQSLKVYF